MYMQKRNTEEDEEETIDRKKKNTEEEEEDEDKEEEEKEEEEEDEDQDEDEEKKNKDEDDDQDPTTKTPQRKTRNSITLELGDIIQVMAPRNTDIHEMTAFIVYIDNETIKLINVATTTFHQLNITEEGRFTDETIEQVYLLNRSEEKGYARQNHLLPGRWIDLHFGGDVPTTITGEITNLEEDMIEVMTYPDLKTIYINFGYKGIPLTLPLEKIILREKPASLKRRGSLKQIAEEGVDGEESSTNGGEEEASIEYLSSGESIISIPEGTLPSENIYTKLDELFVEGDAVLFGEKLETLHQLVEIAEHERRYGIEVQVNDLLDEFLSTIPIGERTKEVMDLIHLKVQRFRELRAKFSKFDKNNNAYEANFKGPLNKPLLEHVLQMDTKLPWILPVVSARRKINNVQLEKDSESAYVITEAERVVLDRIAHMQDDYFNKNSKDPLLAYVNMNRSIDEMMTPIAEPSPQPPSLAKIRVKADMETLVDNLGDFTSDGFKQLSRDISILSPQQYVIQRYNLASSYLEKEDLKSGKTIYTRRPITANDEMTVKSIVLLPDPVVQFSKIHLPTSTLLEKVSFHEQYFTLFRALHSRTDMNYHTVEEPYNELYTLDNKPSKTPGQTPGQNASTSNTLTRLDDFLQKPTEYSLTKETDVTDEDQFLQLLDAVIPKTRFLIKHILKYVTNNVTFIDVVKELAPFLVHASDITFGQRNEIRFFINAKIKAVITQLEASRDLFFSIKNAKYNAPIKPNKLIKRLTDIRDFTPYADVFYRAYQFNVELMKRVNTSASEVLYQMLQMDYGRVYTDLLTNLLFSLMTPSSLLSVGEQQLDDVDAIAKIKPNDCTRRFLTKRYTSRAKLQDDNNTDDIYYDKEFDDTPYEILAKYKDQQKTMEPTLFAEFLKENLIHKHECPPELAGEMVTTLLSKKKRVVNGEYAILEIRPQLPGGAAALSALTPDEQADVEREGNLRMKINYYKRVRGYWQLDNSIGEESFLDNNTLFCNISAKCAKNLKNSVCELSSDAATRMKQIARTKMLSEFSTRYERSEKEQKAEIQEIVELSLKILTKDRGVRQTRLMKQNLLAYAIGDEVSLKEVVKSPYANLRDMILGQDFVSKQNLLLRLADTYCRKPMVAELDEDPHWYYCRETNTKLIPESLVLLAETFMRGGDYAAKLDEVCRNVGKLSDDGDAIVDQHSGYVLKKIEYSTEEGYDAAGFQMSTHDILEKDLGTVVLETMGKKEKRIFNDETSEIIYNVFSAIAANIDIPITGIDETILRLSNTMFKEAIVEEGLYTKNAEKLLRTKGKKLSPYAAYRDFNQVLIIGAAMVIAIQSAVPSFQAKKTFPGCVRSFSGYPLEGGTEDTTGIKYISCVIGKMASSIPPWSSVQKKNVDTIVSGIVMFIDKFRAHVEVEDLFTAKREYVLLHPDSVSPDEHRIEKWLQFMPPIVRLSVTKSLRPMESGFQSELLDQINKKNPRQSTSLAALKSKIMLYGYEIIELINDVVDGKTLLLKTSSQVPFLENACCNDNDLTNPIHYFAEENQALSTSIKASETLILLLRDMQLLSKPPMFYHPGNTAIRYPDIPNGLLEENLYAAILHYCNFDRKLPIPEMYKVICNEKPEGYSVFWTIQEKVAFLKENGKQYQVDHLHHLMRLVNDQNLVTPKQRPYFTMVDRFRDVVENLNQNRSEVIEEPLTRLIIQVLAKYNPKKMSDEITKEVENLKDYLYDVNARMLSEIMAFFRNVKKSEQKKIREFLVNITDWSVDKTPVTQDKYYDEGLYTATQFMQNTVQNMSRVYPTLLLAETGFNTEVPMSWQLSAQHRNDIMRYLEAYYSELEQFKKNPMIMRFIEVLGSQVTDLMVFMENIPVYTEIVKNMALEEERETAPDMRTFHLLFDKETVYMLYTYCFYSVFHEYITLSQDGDMIREHRQVVQKGRRERAASRDDISDSFVGLDQDNTEDENDLLEEVQITMGTQQELKELISSMLVVFLDIEMKNKDTVNMSYGDIMQKVRRSSEKEKSGIMKYLEDMSIEERRVENMFKNFKLGRWNVGEQKGLVQYDRNTYDRERGELLQQIDMDSGVVEEDEWFGAVEAPVTVEELEQEEDDMYNREEDGPLIDPDLDDDYNDGVFYEEDRDGDDFGDDA